MNSLGKELSPVLAALTMCWASCSAASKSWIPFWLLEAAIVGEIEARLHRWHENRLNPHQGEGKNEQEKTIQFDHIMLEIAIA